MSALSCRTLAYGRLVVGVFIGMAGAALMAPAWSQSTDIAKAPLFTQTTVVKPNLLFVLDTSGSMGWDFMPDEVNGLAGGTYGRNTSQCNGVAYDPSYVYTPPVDAAGVRYPNASFGAAWTNGFSTGAGTINLANRVYYRYSGTQPKMGWTFTATAAITTTTFYRECNSVVGNTPGSAVFTAVTMTSASTEAQNYANWYSYYRYRMLMMKTAVGMAFQAMDNKYRIGFTDIHRSLPSLNVSDFDTTQKATFYSDLYGATTGNSTPLRGSLSRAGQYYAKKAPLQTYDPIQYSCQRNFTLLSTDGYWNTGNESSSFGPLKLDNSTSVGQQDGGGTVRPYYDGENVNATLVYKWTRVDSTPTPTSTPRTITTVPGPSTTTATPQSSERRSSLTSAGNTESTSTQVSSPSRSRPGSAGTFAFTITVNGHGYSVGDSIYFTGLSSGWGSGPFLITARATNTFTFSETFSSRPGGSSGTSNMVQKIPAGSCPSGQAYVTTQPQAMNYYGNVTSSSSTAATIDSYVDSTVVNNYSTQNFTQTITTLNGAVTSDNTTSTTTANTPANTTANITTGPTTTTGSTSTTGPVTTPLGWVNNGSATTGTSCVSTATLPSTGTVTTGQAPTTATTIVTSNAGAISITSVGSATTTTGATTQGTPSTRTLFSSSSSTSGGSSNSLADVAMYYYATDLRTSALANCTGALGSDVCANNVSTSAGDTAGWQHMNTFTLGLGAGASLAYNFDYLTIKSGDYYSIAQGTKNWPVAQADQPTAIDDLWHAAVNGRGRFFGVQNASELSRSLSTALESIRAVTGTASAAATSTLQPVQGDNDVFVAQFTTVSWIGDIRKYSIDPSSGVITAVASWSVQDALETKSPGARSIYYKAPASATLRPFNLTNLTTDGYDGNFTNFCTKTGALGTGVPTQCATLTTTDLTLANTSANLIDYLRGVKTATYYRARDKVLGDIVNASPVFVGKPGNKFTENNYATYKSANSARAGVVYTAANDGMLHAFSQSTGDELWAYIPTPMLSKLYKLADNNYSAFHDYFVDGTPSVADVYFSTDSQWHTILVGGYKGGGSGYYALDVTVPTAPVVLWEFTNANMGLSYGNPIITKRRDGTWVVALTSGYNNTSGDGNGHFFIVNAMTGALILDLPTYTVGTTPAGTAGAPSGLGMINGWVDLDTENLTKRYYGADLKGNIWRFDIDSYVQPYNSAMLLAQLRDASNNPQSVSTVPLVAEVSFNGTLYPIVYAATGKYLGDSDLSSVAQQSAYAFVDPLTTTGYGNIRAANVLVPKTAGTSTVVDWSTKKGWMYDFPGAGERANVNSTIAVKTVFTATNVPSSDLCAIGGSSFVYQFDLFTGNVSRVSMGSSLIVGMTVVQLALDGANAGATMPIITKSTGNLETTPGTGSPSVPRLRRNSWRELN